MSWVAVGLGGYLVGAISFARLVGRAVLPGVELSPTLIETGNGTHWIYQGVSATSIRERAGGRWAILVVLLDATKGLLATVIAKQLWPEGSAYLVVTLAVMVGHVWPIWHGFRGGRGQSPLLGSLLVIDPVAILSSILIATAAGLVVFTSAFLAREGFALWLWLWFWLSAGVGELLAFGAAVAIVYAIALRPDIEADRRIRAASGLLEPTWARRVRAAALEMVGRDG